MQFRSADVQVQADIKKPVVKKRQAAAKKKMIAARQKKLKKKKTAAKRKRTAAKMTITRQISLEQAAAADF